ncbi:MAG: hypothetical protein AAGJ79_02630 [Verrucomicrobiota bacterium]
MAGEKGEAAGLATAGKGPEGGATADGPVPPPKIGGSSDGDDGVEGAATAENGETAAALPSGEGAETVEKGLGPCGGPGTVVEAAGGIGAEVSPRGSNGDTGFGAAAGAGAACPWFAGVVMLNGETAAEADAGGEAAEVGEKGLGASLDAISKGLSPAGEASLGAAMDDWFGEVGA